MKENLRRERRQVKGGVNKTLTRSDVQLQINKYVSTIAASTFCHPPHKVCVKGPPGPPGSKGRNGRRGVKGTRGRKGTQGVMGPPGKYGKQGMMGAQGEKGRVGDKGEKGDPGLRGITGLKGDPGEAISAPTVIVSSDSNTVTQNETASFMCSAGGNPRPEVSWEKVNDSLKNSGSDGKLEIHRAQYKDSGQYRCTAKNILGQAHKDVQLIVEGKVLLRRINENE